MAGDDSRGCPDRSHQARNGGSWATLGATTSKISRALLDCIRIEGVSEPAGFEQILRGCPQGSPVPMWILAAPFTITRLLTRSGRIAASMNPYGSVPKGGEDDCPL